MQKIREWLPFLKKRTNISEENVIGRNELEIIGILTATIEHNVKNPLAVIETEIQYGKRKFQALPHVMDFLDRLEFQRQRIYHTMQIVPLLRGEKFFGENFQRISVNSLLEQSVSDIKRELRTYNVFFKKGPFFGSNITIRAHRQLLHQAIINVLKNSIEAIYEAKRKNGVITMGVSKQEEFIAIEITDDGCGIPKKHIDKLTTLFTTKEHLKPNSGLGLFFTKKILSIHNGVIKIESEVGKGTKVSLLLPKA
jgi:signal transduction histidine kinase